MRKGRRRARGLLVVLAGAALVAGGGSAVASRIAASPAGHISAHGSSRTALTNRSEHATPTPSTAASPANAVAGAAERAERTATLTAAIAAAVKGRPGTISVAVYDATSGQTVTFDRGARFVMASTVKLAILARALHVAQADGSALTEEEQALATAMIEHSDNDAASMLWARLGYSAGLRQLGRQLGLTDTAPDSTGSWGLSRTSAADLVTIMKALSYPGHGYSAGSLALAADLLGSVQPDQAWGVSSGATPGSQVMLKNGWLPYGGNWHVNSVGRIHGSGRDYVLAVCTADEASMQDGVSTANAVGTAVWNALG